MSEIKLQSEIVRKFSELFPLKRGQLFHISNERNNKTQAYQARAIGIFPGVSDLIFFEYLDFIKRIRILGIEVKEPGSRHKKDHILQQIEWAEIFIANGGEWILVRTVEGAISFISKGIKTDDSLTVAEVKEMVNNCKTQSIKF